MRDEEMTAVPDEDYKVCIPVSIGGLMKAGYSG
jgi:hypothetical protein